jgi:hypothetical protein
MRNTQSQIHKSALGGYTIEGPSYRRTKLRRAMDRFFFWLGA